MTEVGFLWDHDLLDGNSARGSAISYETSRCGVRGTRRDGQASFPIAPAEPLMRDTSCHRPNRHNRRRAYVLRLLRAAGCAIATVRGRR